jgi:hypothetical protein
MFKTSGNNQFFFYRNISTLYSMTLWELDSEYYQRTLKLKVLSSEDDGFAQQGYCFPQYLNSLRGYNFPITKEYLENICKYVKCDGEHTRRSRPELTAVLEMIRNDSLEKGYREWDLNAENGVINITRTGDYIFGLTIRNASYARLELSFNDTCTSDGKSVPRESVFIDFKRNHNGDLELFSPGNEHLMAPFIDYKVHTDANSMQLNYGYLINEPRGILYGMMAHGFYNTIESVGERDDGERDGGDSGDDGNDRDCEKILLYNDFLARIVPMSQMIVSRAGETLPACEPVPPADRPLEGCPPRYQNW